MDTYISKIPRNNKKPQRCHKNKFITNQDYEKYDDYEYYYDFCLSYANNKFIPKNNTLFGIMNGIERLHYMYNLPYNQQDSFSSVQFYDNQLNKYHIMNTPNLVLYNIIMYLDLESIYALSKTCWKMMLFTRTNIIIQYIYNKFKNSNQHITKIYEMSSHFMSQTYRYKGFFSDFFEIMRKKFKTTRKYNDFDGKMDKAINESYNNPYGYSLYKKKFHVVEFLLYGYNSIIIINGFEYIIRKSMSKFMNFTKLQDFYDIINERMYELSHSLCTKRSNCMSNKRFYYDYSHNKLYYKNTYHKAPKCWETEEQEYYYYDDNFKYDYYYDY